MKSIFKIAVSIIFFTSAHAQIFDTGKLDSLMNIMSVHDMAHGSLTILKDGRTIYMKAIGYSSLEIEAAADIKTRYRIGSVSKMFTAVMIFQLIDEGKLKPDEKLSTFFPALTNAQKITIELLLNHRSGLHDYTDDTNFSEWFDKPKTHDELLDIIRQKGSDFEPGTNARYSNSNYLLLSYIIEKITNETYGNALKKRVTSKLGLKDTYVGGKADVAKNEAVSYKYGGNTWKEQKQTDPGIHGGAGSIVSTPADMTRFIDALFKTKLISKNSLMKMQTMTDDYGLGMFPYNHKSHKGFGHNGRIEEFYSAVRYFPGEKLAIAYCTNGISYPRIDLLEGILKIVFNEPYSIPFSDFRKLKDGELDQYVGKYSSQQLPIVVNIIKNAKLTAETQGTSFELEQIADNYFMHKPTGYFFDFDPEKKQLLVKETDNVYVFTRE